MALSAHDDKVSLSPFSFCHQPGADLAAAALDPMKDGVDSMVLEMGDRIDTEDLPCLGWALAGHNHDRDLLRLVQIRHAFAQGSRRLPAAVPGDEDAIEGDLGPLRLGDQIEMPARSEQNALDQPLGIPCAVGTQGNKAVGGARLAGGNPGDIVSQHIEAPNLYGAPKLLQPPRQQRLSLIAGLARM